MFFKDVLGAKVPTKIKKSAKIADFCQNKKFAEEYVDMVVDRTERVFNTSIKKIKEKSLEDILTYLEMVKQKHSRYGQWKR